VYHPMKKLLFTTLLTTVLYAPINAFSEEITIVVDRKYPPYTYKEKGVIKGAYVDVMKEADKLMDDFEIKFKAKSWAKGLEAMKSGENIALIPPYKNKERSYMTYGTGFAEERVVLICNERTVKEKPSSYPTGYKGLTFSNNTGFASPGAAFFNEVKVGNIKLVESKSTQVNLLKLASKEADCYANDDLVLQQAIKKLTDGNAMRKRDFQKISEFEELAKNDVYVGISVKNNHPRKAEFDKKLNAALKTLKESGRIQEILANYR